MKIILAPDSFKDSLSAQQVCAAMVEGVCRAYPTAEIVQIPMADGGEGTVAALVAATNGQMHTVDVEGPLGETVQGFYGTLGLESDALTAVVEMAAAAGLPLVPPEKRNPSKTSTYGVGQLINAALDEGVRKFIVSIGGSSTNDCGCGMMQALGVRFLDADGCEIQERMNGGNLGRVADIDIQALLPAAKESSFIVACDVENVLLGPTGAVAVYAGQKGADDAMKAELEENMCHIIDLIEKATGRIVRDKPGAGAAGGMGAGMMAFLDADMERGVELVIRHSGFAGKLKGADLVLTGEGKLDRTSGYGKLIAGLAKETSSQGVPLIVLAGGIGEGAEVVLREGVTAYFSICSGPMSLEKAQENAAQLVTNAAEQIMRLYLAH